MNKREQERARAIAIAEAEATAKSHPELETPERAPSRMTSGLSAAVEGIPIVGPYLQSGVENTAAGIGSLLTGKPQPDVRREMGDMVDQSQEAYPGTATAAGIGGAVLGTAPLVAAAPVAFGAGSGPLVARTLASGGTGALLAAADAAVRSGGDPEAIKSGALWGGGLGLAGPAVGAAVGKGIRSIAGRFRGGSGAEKAFVRAAGADAVDDVAGRLAQMGDDALPMDLGPNLQRQAGALAATPGRAQEIIRSTVADRTARAGQRVTQTMDDVLGQPLDTFALAEDIIAKRSAASKPLYDAAYAKPIPFTRELEEILKRPSVGRALKKAQSLALDEGISSKQWFANVADDGTVTLRNVPDVRQLDLTKRALGDMVSSAQRAGNNNEARIFTQLKNRITAIVDESVPEYRAARKAYSGPSEVMDALEEGQKVFSRNLTPNQLRTQMLKMDASQREAFTQGARAEIARAMGTARNDANKAREIFDKGWNAEKLSILVGDEQAQKLLSRLNSETTFMRTRDAVTGNSETAARLAAQRDVGAGAKEPGIFRDAMNFRAGDAAAKTMDRITGAFRDQRYAVQNEELANLLTAKTPQAATRAIRLVQQAQRRGDLAAEEAKRMIQSITLSASQERGPRVPALTGTRGR